MITGRDARATDDFESVVLGEDLVIGRGEARPVPVVADRLTESALLLIGPHDGKPEF